MPLSGMRDKVGRPGARRLPFIAAKTKGRGDGGAPAVTCAGALAYSRALTPLAAANNGPSHIPSDRSDKSDRSDPTRRVEITVRQDHRFQPQAMRGAQSARN
jgi:hypothetical protein